MTISLYDLSVGSYLQALPGVLTTMKKGLEHCLENDLDLDTIVQSCLHKDMLPLRFQVLCVEHHSLGAIEALRSGVFSPFTEIPSLSYQELQQNVSVTLSKLGDIEDAEINSFAGKRVIFKFGETEVPYTAENFIQSFSLPNLYFHITTAYDILRSKGVPLGKRDFLGKMRVG